MPDIILDSHKPALDAGTYELVFSQTLTDGVNVLNTGDQKLKFIVAGEQYALDQQQIDSVFPPAGSMGDFSLVLPHIILNRSTLPWERKAMKVDKKNTPWLALLLFTEDDMSSTEDLTGKSFCVKHIPIKEWDTSSIKKDLISIIVYDNPANIKKILPELEELPYLAHVRATDGEEKAVIVCNRLPKIDSKNIVHLVSLEDCFDANGLKLKTDVNGNTAIVSLKSWEFFCNDHFIVTPEVIEASTFDPDLKNVLNTIQNTEYFKDQDFIDKIKNQIENVNSKLILTQQLEDDLCKAFRIGHLPDILKHLNRTPATLRLPDGEKDNFEISADIFKQYKSSKEKDAVTKKLLVSKDLITVISKIVGKDFAEEAKLIDLLPKSFKTSYAKEVAKQTLTDKFKVSKINFLLNTFRSRKPDEFIQYGYINLPFTLRTGKEIDAFYRGPITPSLQTDTSDPFTLMHSDEAFRYFKDAIKLDVSYASAWELGKLLAIQNKNFSVALYKWKRECYQADKQIGTSDPVIYPDPPQLVKDWFVNLKDLKGIPFNYLIPDPSFIPFESIRFFYVDEFWLKHMIDGAFSIGRISDQEKDTDMRMYKEFDFLKVPNDPRSGFLLHSVAVAGWPDLVIHGKEENVNKASNFKEEGNNNLKTPKVKTLLSQNLSLNLFDKNIKAISIHQKPGSIHFGFEDNGNTTLNFPNKKPSPGDVAKFAKELIQKIEVIIFNCK